MTFIKRGCNIILLIIIALQIWWFSSVPGSEIETHGISIISITYHFTIFFLFSFFIQSSFKDTSKKNITITIIITTIYAILDEIHQIFVPGRYPGIEDVLTDTSGIFTGILIAIYIKTKSKKTISS